MKRFVLASVLLVVPTFVLAQEKLPTDAKLVKLEAQPASVQLKAPFAYSQLVLTGQLETGERIDVTRMAAFEQSGAFFKVSPLGQVRPLGDGQGQLKCSLAGQSVAIPVEISGQKQPYDTSFVRDVMPIISKVGCNAGTCHGAQSGKNGFKLSLRGYDPLYDHRALTDELAARRIDRAAPDASLMLLKPSAAVPHVGGGLIQPGDAHYDMLRLWIAQGVKLDLTSTRVVSLEVHPKAPVLPLPGARQQMVVLAKFADGAVRDVSAEAFIESSNTEVATVDKAGLVTAVRRGEAAMLARYEGVYAAATLIVMGDRTGYTWKDVPTYNWVDELVYEKLKQVKVLPSETCTDAEFIRRLYLDLIGLPPLPDELKAFLADTRPQRVKRDELVDKLIGSPEFIEHWTNKWADLLQVNRKFLGEQGAKALRDWIRFAIADNVAYDRFTYQVLTASGSNVENPPASYFKTLRDPGTTVENTTQLFLATRFNCNKCHDHPFERWTQDQYYHLAAYFAQLERKEDPKYKNQKIGGSAVEGAVPLVEVIADIKAGEVKHDRTGQVSAPKFPYEHGDQAPATASRREQFARWVASKENPYFARSYVNRLWSYLLGVGLIEPVDDIRAGNPASNPKLLDRLTEEFVKSGFNTRHVIRTICKSRTYQHSIVANKWNEGDELNYAKAVARRLPAEVLYDAVHRVTGSVSQLPGLPPGTRAAQLLDSNVDVPSGFLDLFGKPPRESACECERSSGMMLGPILNLVNGPIVGGAIKDKNNAIAKLVATEKDDAKVVDEIFLAILCRKPTPQELAAGVKAIQSAEQDYQRLQQEYARRVNALAAYEKDLPKRQQDYEATLKDVPEWTTLDGAGVLSTAGATMTRQSDGSILVSGKRPSPDTYRIVGNTDLANVTAIRLEVLTDPSLPGKGPGRAPNGNFVLTEFRALAAAQGDENAKKLNVGKAIASFEQEGLPIGNVLDSNQATGWAVVPRVGQAHTAYFELKEPAAHAKGATLTIELDNKFNLKDHTLGKFRLSVTSAKLPLKLDAPPENILKIARTPADKRTPEQLAAFTNYFRGQDKELARLQREVSDFGEPGDKRLVGAQDLAWALINSPGFLFNH